MHTYKVEVFSSGGETAIMRDGLDVAHIVFPENGDDATGKWRADEAEQTAIITAIAEALEARG